MNTQQNSAAPKIKGFLTTTSTGSLLKLFSLNSDDTLYHIDETNSEKDASNSFTDDLGNGETIQTEIDWNENVVYFYRKDGETSQKFKIVSTFQREKGDIEITLKNKTKVLYNQYNNHVQITNMSWGVYKEYIFLKKFTPVQDIWARGNATYTRSTFSKLTGSHIKQLVRKIKKSF